MALLFSVLLGLSTAILVYFIYDINQQNFIRETEAAIDTEITTIMELSHMSGQGVVEMIAHREQRDAYPFYLYLDNGMQHIAGRIMAMPAEVERVSEGIIQFEVPLDNELHLVAAKVHIMRDGRRLMVARDISMIEANRDMLQLLSMFSIVFMVMVIGISIFLSVFVVNRINVIAAGARNIMDTGDLSRRISVQTQWDDLGYLANTLNSLLERIEFLMEGVKQVSDNIAHDLRTPLTRMRNQLEELQKRKVAGKQADQLLKEADQLLQTFNALLRIANIEAGKRHAKFEQVQMDVLINDVIELYAPVAEDAHVSLNTEIEIVAMLGDRNLLFQTVANLIDNAIKFTPKEGNITITLRQGPEGICITVADSGPGISAEDQEKVFRRFYRADASRNKPGNGLGLSLVAAVVELHKGSIMLLDNTPGLKVEIIVPEITET